MLLTGFKWDRQWLVVNSKGRAFTQRVEPKLALVEVHLPQDAFLLGWEPSKESFLGEKRFFYSHSIYWLVTKLDLVERKCFTESVTFLLLIFSLLVTGVNIIFPRVDYLDNMLEKFHKS